MNLRSGTQYADNLSPGIVADDPDQVITFHSTTPQHHGGMMASSISSLAETGSNIIGSDPYDFSCYMDQVRPLKNPISS